MAGIGFSPVQYNTVKRNNSPSFGCNYCEEAFISLRKAGVRFDEARGRVDRAVEANLKIFREKNPNTHMK